MLNEKEKSCYWASICYDLINLNKYIDYCSKYGLISVISPLHNQDLREDGTTKVPHYHIMLILKNRSTRSVISKLFDNYCFKGCERIFDMIAYHDYMYHKENVDKAIYDPSEMKYINCQDSDFISKEYISETATSDIIANKFTTLKQLLTYYNYNTLFVKEIKLNSFFYKCLLNENKDEKVNVYET